MNILKTLLIQILVIATLSFIYEWAFSPMGEDLAGIWKSEEGQINVPFLEQRKKKLSIMKEVDVKGDAMIVPQFFGSYMEIRVDGEKKLSVGRKDVNTFWNDPVYLNVPRGKRTIEISIEPGYDIVGITRPPYISNSETAFTRFSLIKFLGSHIFLLAFIMPIFFSLFVEALSREFVDEKRKSSYRLIGVGLFLAGLAVMDYTPLNFLSANFLKDLIILITTLSSFASPLLLVAGIEKNSTGSKKFTNILLIISASSFVVSLFVNNIIYLYPIEMIPLMSSTVFVYLLDRRYASPLLFYSLVVVHDELSLIFSHGFPQLIPYGSIALSSGMAIIVSNEYGKIGRKLEILNEELTTTNEEIMAMNEELESTYKEQELTINKLESLIALTSKIVKGTYDFEDEEDFLKEILNRAMEIIPEADYGSVAIVNGKKWRFVHAVGHDIKKLREMSFRKEDFIDIRKNRESQKLGDGIALVEDIAGKTLDNMDSEKRNAFEKATLPISKTLISQFKADEEFLGHLTVDIAQGSEKEFSRDSIRVFTALGNIASAFLAFKRLSKLREEFQKEIILSIIHIVEIHDPYTKGHSESVARISVEIAKELDFSEKDLEKVYWAGLVHDLGKILVPGDILRKNGRLSDEEYEIIKKHPIWSYETLIYSDRLKDIAVYTRHHHERWDGKGYPDGLRGDSIPLISRIISIADTWDAMRSNRPYRKALPIDEAIRRMREAAGVQLDPEITEIFLSKVVKRLESDEYR